MMRKLAIGLVGLGLAFSAAIWAEQAILDSRRTRFDHALASAQLSEALSELALIAQTKRYGRFASHLAHQFWLAANRSTQPVVCDPLRLTQQTDAVLLGSFEATTSELAQSSETLSTMRLLIVSEEALESRLAEQRAYVLLARAAMVKDPDAAARLLPRVADLDPAIREITPSAVLGTAFLLRGKHSEIVSLREKRLPILKPPLSGDEEALLAIEVLSSQEARGTTEAAQLAKKYMERGLLADRRHLARMQQIAALVEDRHTSSGGEAEVPPPKP